MGSPDVVSIAFRVVAFVLLMSACGAAIFRCLFGNLLSASRQPVVRLCVRFAIAAIVAVTAHHALEAARMAGEMDGLFDPALQMIALRSSAGAAFALQIIGLAVLAFGAGRRWLGLTGAVLAVAAFDLTGHTSVNPHRAAAAALLALHLLIVAFWTGSLWPLYLAAGREQPRVTARLIEAFSRIAAWVVPLILLAGVGLTVLLVPSLEVFRQPYGRLLLAKVALFSLLMWLAVLNRYNYGPACETGDTQGFRRTVVSEYIIICGVLAITAVLTMFYSPEAP